MFSPDFSADHRQAMRTKISLLHERGAVDVLERLTTRRFTEHRPGRRLGLRPGIALPEHYPDGLRALYEISDGPTFGDLNFHSANHFNPANRSIRSEKSPAPATSSR